MNQVSCRKHALGLVQNELSGFVSIVSGDKSSHGPHYVLPLVSLELYVAPSHTSSKTSQSRVVGTLTSHTTHSLGCLTPSMNSMRLEW